MRHIARLPISFYLLSLATLVAFFFRFYLIPTHLFFSPEQGIDLFVIRDIVIFHKLTLIGAKTDIAGIFHGPLYYYLATIPFVLTRGNPVAISGFFIFLNSLTVFPLFFLTKRIFSKQAAIFSVIFFCIAYEAILYPRWLTSQPLAIPLMTLCMYFYVRFLEGSRFALIGWALAAGLVGQTEFLNFLFLAAIFVPQILLDYKKFLKVKIGDILVTIVLLFLVSLGNYILFDIRHQFLMTKSLIGLFHGKSGFHTTLPIVFDHTLQIFGEVQNYIISPFIPSTAAKLVVLCLFVFSLFFTKKYHFLWRVLLWWLGPALTLILLKQDVLEHFFVLTIPATIILLANFSSFFFSKQRVIGSALIAAILLTNVYAWYTFLPTNQHVFFQSTQPTVTLRDQQLVIKKIYTLAHGAPFLFHPYTIPYNYPMGWNYLFDFYGKPYGYLPSPDGQVSYLFLVIQDDTSSLQKMWINQEIHRDSKIIYTGRQGAFTIIGIDFRPSLY